MLTTRELEYVVRGYHKYRRCSDRLLLVESRALLVIVLCAICESSLGRFLERPTERFGVSGCPCCDGPRYRLGAVDQAFKLVGDRCHGTTHVKVTLSLFRTRPPNNLSGQLIAPALERKTFFSGLGGALIGEVEAPIKQCQSHTISFYSIAHGVQKSRVVDQKTTRRP